MKNLLIVLLITLSGILTYTIIKDTKAFNLLLQKHKETVIYTRTLESQMQRVIKDNSMNTRPIPSDTSNIVKIVTRLDI